MVRRKSQSLGVPEWFRISANWRVGVPVSEYSAFRATIDSAV